MSSNKAVYTAAIPPADVAREAARGLELRRLHKRGGTEVGVERARGLVAREPVDLPNLRKIRSYFARHEIDKRGRDWSNKERPSAGYIAWLLWGGEPGRAWATRELEKLGL